jgi:Ca-activated chloride channel family protein
VIRFDAPWLVAGAPAIAFAVTLLGWWARAVRIRKAARWSPELESVARSSGRLTPALLGLAAFCATLALAGPRWGRRIVEAESKGLDLVIAVDISRSMLAEDAVPSRLKRAQQQARRLVHDLEGDRLGLIAFAGQSFILSPLTVDGSALELLIDALDPDIASAGGTNLAAALRQGRDLLRGGSEVADRVLVLFTDGEAHDSLPGILAAAEEIRRDGLRLILVAEGGTAPAPIPVRTPEGEFVEYQQTENGEPVQTWRRDDILTQVADAGHGVLVPAALSDQAGAVRELVRAYQRVPQASASVADRPLQSWLPALLAVGLLVVQTLTRRTAALAALVLGASLGAVRPAAAQWGRNAADAAYGRAAYREAAAGYLRQARRGEGGDTVWFDLGTAALAAGDTALARAALARAAASLDPELRFRALYNAGFLALQLAVRDSARRDRYAAEARERYREALLLRPGDLDAKWNLELALRRASSGGGGGGGGAAQPRAPSAPGGTPQPAGPVVGLSRAQAEQILNSIAQEERQVRQALWQRRLPVREAHGGKNW